jgi:RimJ/RimL family protein N-acetyltransferase
LRDSDLNDFHAYRSNPEICKFQSFKPFSIEESKDFIETQKNAEVGDPGKWVQVGIVLKENHRLIGDLALKPEPHEPRIVEIGVTLNLEQRKKGFAIEALQRAFDFLFAETETHRIFGLLDVENAGSLRLLEHLNFRREAEFKKSYWDSKMNEWRDEFLYALLKDDWNSA